jgi:hypothetical protein
MGEAAHEQGIVHRDQTGEFQCAPRRHRQNTRFRAAKTLEPTGAMPPNLSMSPTITSPAMTHTGRHHQSACRRNIYRVSDLLRPFDVGDGRS